MALASRDGAAGVPGKSLPPVAVRIVGFPASETVSVFGESFPPSSCPLIAGLHSIWRGEQAAFQLKSAVCPHFQPRGSATDAPLSALLIDAHRIFSPRYRFVRSSSSPLTRGSATDTPLSALPVDAPHLFPTLPVCPQFQLFVDARERDGRAALSFLDGRGRHFFHVTGSSAAPALR